MVATLRMKHEYIEWSISGRKWATTRLKVKEHGEYELLSGSRFKPVKSGVVIEILKSVMWTRSTMPGRWLEDILDAEDSSRDKFGTKKEFIDELEKLNKKTLGENTLLYTYFYRIKRMKYNVGDKSFNEIKPVMEGKEYFFKRQNDEVFLCKEN